MEHETKLEPFALEDETLQPVVGGTGNAEGLKTLLDYQISSLENPAVLHKREGVPQSTITTLEERVNQAVKAGMSETDAQAFLDRIHALKSY